jgi:hypothetical protein
MDLPIGLRSKGSRPKKRVKLRTQRNFTERAIRLCVERRFNVGEGHEAQRLQSASVPAATDQIRIRFVERLRATSQFVERILAFTLHKTFCG